MKNDGNFKRDQVTVTQVTPTEYKVSIPQSKGQPVEFAGLTFSTENVKEITITPASQDGQESGKPVSQAVAESEQQKTIVFPTAEKGDILKITLTPTAPEKAIKFDVVSVKACVESDGKYIMNSINVAN
jgi:hypothetical protein